MTLYKRSTRDGLSFHKFGFKKKKNQSIVWELEVRIAIQSHFQENILQKPKILNRQKASLTPTCYKLQALRLPTPEETCKMGMGPASEQVY